MGIAQSELHNRGIFSATASSTAQLTAADFAFAPTVLKA